MLPRRDMKLLSFMLKVPEEGECRVWLAGLKFGDSCTKCCRSVGKFVHSVISHALTEIEDANGYIPFDSRWILEAVGSQELRFDDVAPIWN